MPPILLTRGVQCRDRVCARADAQLTGSAPAGKLVFDSRVYGAPTVKEVLVRAQNKKCCYCETIVGSDGDVEHFRPKGGVQQSEAEPLQTPGYYWLAFEWTNLLLSCKACNQHYKKNLFPLRNPARRARTPSDDVAREEPLLIDPAAVDPEAYLSFRREIPYAPRGNRLGRSTLAVLQLHRREDLIDRRRTYLQHLVEMRNVIQMAQGQPGNKRLQRSASRAADFIQRALSDAGEFSAMTRAARKSGLL